MRCCWAALLLAIPCFAGVIQDAAYPTFTAACAAAAGATLAVGKTWQSVPSQHCGAALEFSAGGRLQLAPSAVVTLTGSITAPPMHIFDTSASGSSVVLGAGALPAIFPQWWGARADGTHDDTHAIQAAIDAAVGPWNGVVYPALTQLVLLSGRYRITSQLRIYSSPAAEHQGAYWSFVLRGSGKGQSVISFDASGDLRQAALRIIGGFAKISDLEIIDNSQAGWISGIEYDGDRKIGTSYQGRIADVTIDCNGNPGDGIGIGRSRYQADTLTVDHASVGGCTSGHAIATYDSNALSTNLYSPSLGNSWIGVLAANSTNLSIFGGEIDSCDVNFMPESGTTFLVEGVRSEESKRTVFTGRGAAPQSFTLQNYALSDLNTARPVTKVTGSAGNGSISLSTPGFTFGDQVIIAAGGKDLHTKIIDMKDPLHATVAPAPETALAAASMSLDTTVKQNDLEENSAGPYLHAGSTFNVPESASTAYHGEQIFIGNSWSGAMVNPFGSISSGVFADGVMIGNLANCASGCSPMPNFYKTAQTAPIPLTPNRSTVDLSAGTFFETRNTSATTIDIMTVGAGSGSGPYGRVVYILVNDDHTSFANTKNIQMTVRSPYAAKKLGVYVFVSAYNSATWSLIAPGGY